MQNFQSTFRTTPIEPPAAYAAYQASGGLGGDEAFFKESLSIINWGKAMRLIPGIRSFLPTWNCCLELTFPRAWWKGEDVEWNSEVSTQDEAYAYFQVRTI